MSVFCVLVFCFVPAGISLAQSSGNATLQRECASILEGMRQWQDAAMLYETAGAFEKAVRFVFVYSLLLRLPPPRSSAVSCLRRDVLLLCFFSFFSFF